MPFTFEELAETSIRLYVGHTTNQTPFQAVTQARHFLEEVEKQCEDSSSPGDSEALASLRADYTKLARDRDHMQMIFAHLSKVVKDYPYGTACVKLANGEDPTEVSTWLEEHAE